MTAQTNLSGIINSYAKVTQTDTCTGRLDVSSTAGFAVGTRVLLIQMQGAVMNQSNSLAFGDVQNLRDAGFFEINEVDSVAAGQVFLKNKMMHGYNTNGAVQLVTFPKYQNAMVADSIFPKPWDGSTGGVLALEIENTLDLQGHIIADGMGFRGGLGFVATDNDCWWLFSQNDYSYASGSWRGANKGEGISAIIAGKELGRGAQVNGGGGGNDHNSGGGGGANQSTGGQGGINDEPQTVGCDGDFPGLGGKAISFNGQRIFMGGGGGAGHANNNPVGKGGNGGGIVLLVANSITGNGSISANGEDGQTSTGDGGGGGGAGGSLLLFANAISPDISISANGGNGGSTRSGQERCFGPGGGGAGGFVRQNFSQNVNLAGGTAGKVALSQGSCLGSSLGATNGQNGNSATWQTLPASSIAYGDNVPKILQNPLTETICIGEMAVFECLAEGPISAFQWQQWNGSAWVNTPSTSPYSGANSTTLTISSVPLALDGGSYRCLVSFGNCSTALASDEAVLNVENGPIAQFSGQINGQTVVLDNQSQNYNGLLWAFGDGNTSTEAQPTHSFANQGNYTITLTVWNACDTVQQSLPFSYITPPLALFAVSDTLRSCAPASVQFSNQSAGLIDQVNWSFPNGTPAASTANDVSVSYSQSGNYSASLIVGNAAGKDTLTIDFYVELLPDPVPAFSYSIVSNEYVFANQSQHQDSQLWDFGDGSTSTELNPTHTYANDGTYTVTLTVTNTCETVTTSQTLTVIALPNALFTVADSIADCDEVEVPFSHQSTGNITQVQWLFPSGNPMTSTQNNVTVKYSQSGQKTATLIVGNAAGNDTLARDFVVEVLTFPDAVFAVQQTGFEAVFLNQSTDYQIVSWNFGDGSPLVFEDNPTHTYAANGTYIVTLTVGNSCGASVLQKTIVVDNVMTVEAFEKLGIRLFPNPTSGLVKLNISLAKDRPIFVDVMDIQGRKLASKPLRSEEETIDLSERPNGSYVLRLHWEDRTSAVLLLKI